MKKMFKEIKIKGQGILLTFPCDQFGSGHKFDL